MSQFGIYKNNNPNTSKNYPYLMDIQSPLLDALDTRLVVPLSLKSTFLQKPISVLNPVLNFKGAEYIVLTQQMAAIHSRNLGTRLGDALAIRHEILASIDLLITGF